MTFGSDKRRGKLKHHRRANRSVLRSGGAEGKSQIYKIVSSKMDSLLLDMNMLFILENTF